MIIVAKAISTIFRPIYYPLLCCCILFTFTPLSRFPLNYKVIELAEMMLFTIAIPMLLTLLYRAIFHIDNLEMRKRSKRIVPYLIFITSYFVYIYLLRQDNMNRFIISVITVALCIQIVCMIINLGWKVSVHAAGAGAIIGAIAAYSRIFMFNPLFWLSIAFLVTGAVGSARMILRQHNLSQIIVGTMVGILCGFYGIKYGNLMLPF